MSQMVTLTGTYMQNNLPAEGRVIITPNVNVITDSVGNTVMNGPFFKTLVAGSFSIDLPPTDDPTIRPLNFGYILDVELTRGLVPRISFGLPAVLGTLDVTDLYPEPGNGDYIPVLKGDSAYDIAVANGFVGTEADWVATFLQPSQQILSARDEAVNSATSATASATSATNSATASDSSETNAANSATAASNSETAAANSAAASATSATNSADSATAADSSATEAATSAAEAAASASVAIPNTLLGNKGDLVVATANDTPAVLPVGAGGSFLMPDANAASGLSYKTLPVLATNFVPDPTIQVLPGSVYGGALSHDSSWESRPGVESVKYVASTIGETMFFPAGGFGTMMGLSPGGTYTASITLRLNSVLTQTDTVSRRLAIRYEAVSGSGIVWSEQAPNRPGIYRLHVTATLPIDATAVMLEAGHFAEPGSGDSWWTDVLVTESVHDSPYGDGDQPGWRWTGTPHASTSEKLLVDNNDYVRGGVSAPVLATNLAPNPTGRTGLDSSIVGYAAGPQTIDAITGIAPPVSGVTTGYRLSFTSGSTSAGLAVDASGWQAGDKVSASMWVKRVSGVDSMGMAMAGVSSSLDLALQVGVWTRVSFTFTAVDAVARHIGLRCTGAGATGPNEFEIAAILIEIGNQPSPKYFDGDTPGCRWTGVPSASTSEKLLLGSSDYMPRTVALKLEGIGFPTMDAPVGSEYIDLAQTNGARAWRKLTVGTGTDKWRVYDGDTGWRNVSNLPLNGWSSTSGIFLRRTNLSITLAISGVSAANATGFTLMTLPVGFRHSGFNLRSLVYNVTVAPPAIKIMNVDIATDVGISGYASSDTIVRNTIEWVTTESWPSVLPGTPA